MVSMGFLYSQEFTHTHKFFLFSLYLTFLHKVITLVLNVKFSNVFVCVSRINIFDEN